MVSISGISLWQSINEGWSEIKKISTHYWELSLGDLIDPDRQINLYHDQMVF